MVTMVINIRYLINFTFYGTFKDEPIPHKNFMFLHQGSYEIAGGGSARAPSLVSDIVPKPLVSEGLIGVSLVGWKNSLLHSHLFPWGRLSLYPYSINETILSLFKNEQMFYCIFLLLASQLI